MTEKEKSQLGELYDPMDKELTDERTRAMRACAEYNAIPRDEEERRTAFMKKFLGKTGEALVVESNIWFDYGYNVEVGENFYINHDCVFVDTAKITFGDDVFIGPQCGFYTAQHPLDFKTRNKALEYAFPIKVGHNVWIGGGTKVMPGATIGDGAVIGGGSVVVGEIPANCVAVGNPARVIKKIEQ